MRRGGRPVRRYVIPNSVPVWVSSGRWGPGRARVEQCVTLRAELVYHQMICERSNFGPGSRAELTWRPNGSNRSWSVTAEIAANAVWRRGRLFFHCPMCCSARHPAVCASCRRWSLAADASASVRYSSGLATDATGNGWRQSTSRVYILSWRSIRPSSLSSNSPSGMYPCAAVPPPWSGVTFPNNSAPLSMAPFPFRSRASQ